MYLSIRKQLRLFILPNIASPVPIIIIIIIIIINYNYDYYLEPINNVPGRSGRVDGGSLNGGNYRNNTTQCIRYNYASMCTCIYMYSYKLRNSLCNRLGLCCGLETDAAIAGL